MITNMEIWQNLNKCLEIQEGISLKEALSKENKFKKEALLYAAKTNKTGSIIYGAIVYDEYLDIIRKVSWLHPEVIDNDQLVELAKEMPNTEFKALHISNNSVHKKLAQITLMEEKSKEIRPITLKQANDFVILNHRHHDSCTGCKFAIGLYKQIKGKDTLIGVAICGRPVSRYLDNGLTLEINRLCTIEDDNACSMLYGACVRIAKDMGYKKVITYILESESGVSLKASNFTLEDECCGGKEWTGKRKKINSSTPKEMKQRWGIELTA